MQPSVKNLNNDTKLNHRQKYPGSLSSQKVVVACTVDSGFAAPLAATLYSAARSTSRRMRVYVAGVDLTSSDRERINHVCARAQVEVSWIDGSDVHPDVFGLPKYRSRYLRVSLASLLPSDLDRVIYLDADTLVCRDLAPLFESEISNYALMAVRDFRIPYVSAPLGLKNYQDLGISPDAPYFNSGVLLLNLNVWRKQNVEKKIVDYYQAYGFQMTLHDQEILNAVLHDQWGELDLRWNQQSVLFRPQAMPKSEFKSICMGRSEDLRLNPAIVHFTGGSKPWTYCCLHPLRRDWHRAFRRSGWFSTPTEYASWYGRFVVGDTSRRVWSKMRRRHA